MHSYSLEESAAVERIKETDKQRKKYYSYYTGGDWEAASNYDLCLNTGTRFYFSGDNVAEITGLSDGYDPEKGTSARTTLPFSRSWTLGVDLTF